MVSSSIVSRLDIPAETVERARQNLQNKTAVFLVVSGKQASGKDTVAPVLLTEMGYHNTAHLSYALPLKAECDAIIGTLRYNFGKEQYPVLSPEVVELATKMVSEKFNIPADQTRLLIADLIEAAREDETLTARSRTPVMRFVLQYLGTEIRRSVDEDYWVAKALPATLDALARGQSVYVTDARFPNEVWHAQQMGALAVRLDVPQEVQLERLMARDNIVPSHEALTHPSEVALDDYEHFNVRCQNIGPLKDVVQSIVEQLTA